MDCLFCKIIAGEIPSRKVYSDDKCYAFLDIAPWQRGHSLVVPRRHVPDLTSESDALAEISTGINKVSNLLKDCLKADAVNLLINSGSVAGQEVLHLHAHIIPRYADCAGIGNMIRHDQKFDLDEICSQLS